MKIKKLITCCSLCIAFLNLPAQTAVSILDDGQAYKYGELIGQQLFFRRIINVRVDTGQTILRENNGRGRLEDGSEFFPYESFVAALNDIAPMGWRPVSVYTWPNGDAVGEVRWIVRRRLKE